MGEGRVSFPHVAGMQASPTDAGGSKSSPFVGSFKSSQVEPFRAGTHPAAVTVRACSRSRKRPAVGVLPSLGTLTGRPSWRIGTTAIQQIDFANRVGQAVISSAGKSFLTLGNSYNRKKLGFVYFEGLAERHTACSISWQTKWRATGCSRE